MFNSLVETYFLQGSHETSKKSGLIYIAQSGTN